MKIWKDFVFNDYLNTKKECTDIDILMHLSMRTY